MKVYRRTQKKTANPDQSQDSANGLEDLLCGGGFDCVPVQGINSVVEGYFDVWCGCCHYQRLGVRRTGRVVEVEFNGCRQLHADARCAYSANAKPMAVLVYL